MPDKTDLAADRTDLAEDRTLLANERTFAGWMRTALASVGLGVGFNALFRDMEPAWVPKSLATLFILIGVATFWSAQRRACRVFDRLDSHEVSEPTINGLRLIAWALSFGALGLIGAIWFLA